MLRQTVQQSKNTYNSPKTISVKQNSHDLLWYFYSFSFCIMLIHNFKYALFFLLIMYDYGIIVYTFNVSMGDYSIHLCMYEWEWVYVCMCVKAKVNISCLCQLLSTLFFETEFLNELGNITKSDKLIGQQILGILLSPFPIIEIAGAWFCIQHLAWMLGIQNKKWNLHAC